MIDRRQELLDRIDEAEFELLLDDYQNSLGNACQKAYEKACAQGNVSDMPEEIKARTLKFIDEYPSHAKKRRHPAVALRCCLIAAIIFVTIFGLLMTAQAAGFDVFSMIGRWSEAESRCVGQPDENYENAAANEALEGLPEALTGNESSAKTICLPEDCTDFDEEEYIAEDQNAEIDSSQNEQAAPASSKEADNEEPEIRQISGMLENISQNIDRWIGIWKGNIYCMNLSTKIEKKPSKKTDSTPSNETPSDIIIDPDAHHTAYKDLYEALNQSEIPSSLAPTWLPEGFTEKGTHASADAKLSSVSAEYINRENDHIVIEIDHFPKGGAEGASRFEESEGETETYQINGMLYAIFPLADYWGAVWEGETDSVYIMAKNKKDLIAMIDSIPFRVTSPEDSSNPAYDHFYETLHQSEFPVELSPTWLPEGFTENAICADVNEVQSGITAEYGNQENDRITIEIAYLLQDGLEGSSRYENIEEDPEIYEVNGTLFMLLQNDGNWVGAWKGNPYCVYVTAKDKENLLAMIDSIPFEKTPFDDFYDALDENKIPVELAPTYLPEEYTQTQTATSADTQKRSVTAKFSSQVDSICIRAARYLVPPEGADAALEDAQEPYMVGEMEYAIFPNGDDWVGSWQDADYGMTIQTPDKAALFALLDSIPAALAHIAEPEIQNKPLPAEE